MKAFNKKTKVAMLAGTMVLSGIVASPAFAQEPVTTTTAVPTVTSFPVKENRVKMDDDFLRGKFDDDDRDEDRGRNYNIAKIKMEDMQKILASVETSNYESFKTLLTNAGVTKIPTQEEFSKIVEAYKLAKAGDVKGAQKILKDNNLDPMLHKFVMGQHMQLTDAQKEAIKKAEELVKQGKTEEAKAILTAAGLPNTPVKTNTNEDKREVIKTALEKAKTLRSEGKKDEAKQVLKDAGIPEKSVKKLEKEFKKEEQTERKSFVQIFKNFFKFGKN